MKSYDEIYKENPNHPWTFDDWEETKLIVDAVDSWEGKTVLDIGCGTGDLVNLLSQRFAVVIGIDPTITAIEQAEEKYPSEVFECLSYKERSDVLEPLADNPSTRFEVITMKGVLEHVEGDPFIELKWIMDNLLKEDGTIILTCPGWCNPRGFAMLTMAYLYNEPITRADRHYLFPWQFEDFAHREGLEIEMWSSEYDWAWSGKFRQDFEQRLPKIFNGSKEIQIRRYLKDLIEPYTGWFEVREDLNQGRSRNLTGAVLCAKLWRNNGRPTLAHWYAGD